MKRPYTCLFPSIAICIALGGFLQPAQASVVSAGNYIFQVTPLDYPGAQNTLAYGINDSGEVVGYYFDPTLTGGSDKGFTYSPADFSFTSIDAGSQPNTDLYGVNNAGTTVGSYFGAPGNPVFGLVVTGGVPSVPGPAQTEYYGINNQGAIVGSSFQGAVPTGFYQSGGTSTPILNPNAQGTYVHGANDNNTVVGFYQNSDGTYTGFKTTSSCVQASCMTTVGPPGSYSSFAYGINDSGWITGVTESSSGIYQGFLYDGSNYDMVDIPGATDTYLAGINNLDQIVGWYKDSSGNYHAFELSATPEPTSLYLLLPVMLAFAFRRFRSRRQQSEVLHR